MSLVTRSTRRSPVSLIKDRERSFGWEGTETILTF